MLGASSRPWSAPSRLRPAEPAAAAPDPAIARLVARARYATIADLAALEAIYLDAFDEAARDPWEWVLDKVADGSFLITMARLDGRAAGLAVQAVLPRAGVVFGIYLAVDRPLRRGGIGSSIVAALYRFTVRLPGVNGGLAEVDRAEDAADEADRLVRQARLRLYASLGAYPLPQVTGYAGPDLRGSGMVPFHLVWWPVERAAEELDGPALRAMVTELWAVAYDLSVDDEPTLQDVLDRLVEPESRAATAVR